MSNTARRAGWIGCNILIGEVPDEGKIDIIQNGVLHPKNEIYQKINKSNILLTENIETRGWLLDVLKYVNIISSREFCLNDMYSFEKELYFKHPQNNNIKAKIRQQLQVLRDKGFIEFLGNGKYRKVI